MACPPPTQALATLGGTLRSGIRPLWPAVVSIGQSVTSSKKLEGPFGAQVQGGFPGRLHLVIAKGLPGAVPAIPEPRPPGALGIRPGSISECPGVPCSVLRAKKEVQDRLDLNELPVQLMPENATFPYRRYDRLPPIHQFSIESDTDLSETAELIEEYEVFDPARPRPKILLVLGGPGSGKGTQSLKIAEHFGFEYISVGELLRKRIHSTSSNRKWSLIAKIITTGELAPQETTITEIKQKLMQMPDEEGIVIDGFPRDVAQAMSFEDQICTPDLVVFLACTSHRLKERLLKRAEQQGRPDDNAKATQRRLVHFKQNAAPLIQYFQEKGLIATFDADREEDEVFRDISLAVATKLFPSQEAAAAGSDSDLRMDTGDWMAAGSDSEEQGDEDDPDMFGDDTAEDFAELRKFKIVFVIGGPGSGKGTQCEKLVQKYGFAHVSVAELLRGELASGSPRSLLLRDALERGGPLSAAVVLDLLKEALLARSAPGPRGFLVEGYPQELKQGQEFERRVGPPQLVICMECSADTMSRRLLQRDRESPEAVARRLQTYYQASLAVAAHYEETAPFHKINAEGSPEEVFLHMCSAVDAIF
ncbi:adenylate kinase isoenzyme 5 [Gracilinanus agilis]|uniref:adenylate kinase isoenzyme 5 n=1 Tax=Gracilinanus agilis TaxID=191870 RepID=UPI001CFF2FC1|nr:adenylate kinase isoenzyme 5 [Gracilinanus agilis]